MTATPQLLAVEWPAPARVRAAFSTRRGGLSQGVHASLNLGSHVGDDPGAVAANRRLLVEAMAAEGFTNYVDEWWHFSFVVPDAVPYDLPLERW